VKESEGLRKGGLLTTHEEYFRGESLLEVAFREKG